MLDELVQCEFCGEWYENESEGDNEKCSELDTKTK